MRRGDLLGIVGLVALVTLFFWRLWAPNPADRVMFPEGDFTHQYWPLRRFVARELAQGRLPLWNPYVWAGQPGLADPQAASLYPPAVANALLWGADFPLNALALEVVLHVIWAGVGAFLLARCLMPKAPPMAPFTAGVAFALSGYMTGFPLQQVTIVETAAWLPWWLWALHRMVRAPRPAVALVEAVGAGWVLALMLLAGHPQTALYAVYLGLAYLLTHIGGRAYGWKERLLLIPMPFLLAAGLSAAQVVPTLDFIARSERATLDYAFVRNGLPWDELVTAVFPNFFGGTPLYVGPVVLVLAALGLAGEGKDRVERWFWAGVTAVGLLVATGGAGGVYQLLYLGLPGWDRVRAQERALFVVALAMALLAAWGVAHMAAGLRRPVRWALRGALWGLLPLAWIAVRFYAVRAEIISGARQGNVDIVEGFLGNVLLALVLVAMTAAALALARRRPREGAALATLLVAYNLFTVNHSAYQGSPPSALPTPPESLVAAAREATAEGRLHDQGLVLWPQANAGMVYSLELLSGNTPLRLAHTARFFEAVPPWFQWKVLAVQYTLANTPLEAELFVPVAEQGGITLYRLTRPRPRLWLVEEVVPVSSAEAAWERLDDEGFDVYRTALVEGKAPPVGGRGDVRLVRRQPGYVAARVEAKGPVMLVVSEVADPGWRVWVNGAQARWVRVYGMIIGVPLPGGTYDVELVYAPPNWLAARLISLSTVALSLLLASVAVRRARSPHSYPKSRTISSAVKRGSGRRFPPERSQ
ncbi:MAG: hypothetical protein Q9O62_09450 [Ardenticatenia bacterium]|nr:hypothetical protein [Ardenticatenia bacterium]